MQPGEHAQPPRSALTRSCNVGKGARASPEQAAGSGAAVPEVTGPGLPDAAADMPDSDTPARPATFRDWYMDRFLTAFAPELAALQEAAGGQPPPIDVLVKCIESGVDLFSERDQRVCMEED